MHTMKSDWVGLNNNQPRLIGLMLAVLVVVSSYGWGQEAKSPAGADVFVNVGESVTVEVPDLDTGFVADNTIADLQLQAFKNQVLVIGKKPGVTTLKVSDKTGAVKTHRVVVRQGDHDTKTLEEAIAIPSVKVRLVGNAAVLEGTVSNERELERALSVAGAYREKVINLVEVHNPAQVRIRTQVAEVNLTSAKKKGFEYPDSITYTMDLGAENVLASDASASQLGFGSPFATILHGFSTTSSGGQLNAPDQIDSGIFARLNILQANGDLKILAEPTLVTLSGKEASFLAGGEFPVVIALQNSFSVEFKEFGVRVKIKPVVDSKENINMVINVELSAIDPSRSVSSSSVGGGVNLPFLTTRRASSSLQVKSGQTILIGGLLDRQTTESLRKVPWIGDVPVLGLLFTSKARDNSERELIFLVTPDLVRDAAEEAKAAPTSNRMKDLLKEPKFQQSEEEWQKAHGKRN